MTKQRLVLLDATRGLAILGIFLANIPYVFVPEIYSQMLPLWPQGNRPDSLAVWWVTQVFFQQKFYALFAMLFGASLLLIGGVGDDRSQTVLVVKRLVALLVIALFHGLIIWQGDVLWTYALVGLLLLPFRAWSARRLLVAGIAVHIGIYSYQLWSRIRGAAQLEAPLPPQALEGMAKEAARQTAGFTGSFSDSLLLTAQNYWAFISSSWQVVPDWPLKVLALILMGMSLFKSGLLKGQAAPALYRALIAIGFGALALVAVAQTLYLAIPTHPLTVGWLAHWMQGITAPVVGLGYLGLLALALRTKSWSVVTSTLAPVGQMALTNYIAQSIIMTVLAFGGRGPNLYGQLDRPALAGIVVVTWVIQILWSHWWLRHFTTGPLEWLWRLAYRGRMPIRRRSTEIGHTSP